MNRIHKAKNTTKTQPTHNITQSQHGGDGEWRVLIIYTTVSLEQTSIAMTSFRRTVGASADVKELQYIAALNQTCEPLCRANGTISSLDVQRFLQSRHGLKISHAQSRDIVRGLGGSALSQSVAHSILRKHAQSLRSLPQALLARKKNLTFWFGGGKRSDEATPSQDHDGNTELVDTTIGIDKPSIEYLDLVQLLSIILIPTFARMGAQSQARQKRQGHLEEATQETNNESLDPSIPEELLSDVLNMLWSDVDHHSMEEALEENELTSNTLNDAIDFEMVCELDRGRPSSVAEEGSEKALVSNSNEVLDTTHEDGGNDNTIDGSSGLNGEKKMCEEEENKDICNDEPSTDDPRRPETFLRKEDRESETVMDVSENEDDKEPTSFDEKKTIEFPDANATKQSACSSNSPDTPTFVSSKPKSSPPRVTADFVRALLTANGEYERARDKQLIETMVQAAGSSSGLFDEEAFVNALTSDIGEWKVGSEDRTSSYVFDVFGKENALDFELVLKRTKQSVEETRTGGDVENSAEDEADDKLVGNGDWNTKVIDLVIDSHASVTTVVFIWLFFILAAILSAALLSTITAFNPSCEDEGDTPGCKLLATIVQW
jgi:hypothetical protein